MKKKHKPRIQTLWEWEPDPSYLENYTEAGVEKGARMEDVTDADVREFWHVFNDNDLIDAFDWLDLHQKNFEQGTYVIDTRTADKMIKYQSVKPTLIFNRRPLNEVRHLNTLLNRTNEALADDGYFWCHAQTAVLKKKMLLHRYGKVLGWPIVAVNYFWHRVFPKLKLTRWFYMWITDGRNRTYNRIEVLGRLCRAGFDIVDEEFLHGEFFVLAQKKRSPIWDDDPTYGPLIKLKRVGKDGNLIGVYKFRTMYSYSEYLQKYIYEHVGLQDGGKFKNDPRVNLWGKILRATWLDELPMIINCLRRQIKLVGVRPLSRHYFSLYTPEMQELRKKVKPGLIPPFYYEKVTPVTIEEVQESERRYIEAYLKKPFLTDLRYFFGSVWNIIFHKKKSH